MIASRLIFCALVLVPGTLRSVAETAYSPRAGSRPIATWRGDWHDATRNRTLPVKIYYPADRDGPPSPVIIFSHGLGGTRETYSYLGEYWAAHGYVSVHVQHPGSDFEVIRAGLRDWHVGDKLREAAADPANFVNRPQDIRFAIDELSLLATDRTFPLHGRLRLDRIAVAGHSFGAYTVMAIAGQAVGPDRARRYFGPDVRVKAGIAMSSDAALTANLDDAYSRITIPIFHMTGTKDQVGTGRNGNADAIIGNATPADRRVAYDHTRHAPAYLLTFNGGDHRVFSGRKVMAGGEHDAAFQKIVCLASTAFWDATLKDDAGARRWLEQGGFAQLLGNSGTFEQKRP